MNRAKNDLDKRSKITVNDLDKLFVDNVLYDMETYINCQTKA